VLGSEPGSVLVEHVLGLALEAALRCGRSPLGWGHRLELG
jgi:hypothetical protein